MFCYNRKSGRTSHRISTTLVLSYVLDWIMIIATAGIGGYFSYLTPNKRPFSLSNSEITYPYVIHEKIPTWLLIVVALVVPAVAILLVCLLLVPGPAVLRSTPKSLIWRRKLWEWHTGWLGLALSLAAAFIITSGMKNLFGKPRPDLLSRCHPDVTNISSYYLESGGSYLGTVVVSADICTNDNKSILDDGFRSFPSGHASFSAAGLIYLSLFICSKLAITLPYLAPSLYSQDESRYSAFPTRRPKEDTIPNGSKVFEPSGHSDAIIGARNQAAAPPVYLLVFSVVPFFASIYIASTRYSDFRHHGFDILFGYSIGTVTAVFAFRYYHLPIRQGAGWSWGPRSRDRSFWSGVGVGNYAGNQQYMRSNSDLVVNLELGSVPLARNEGSPQATPTMTEGVAPHEA